MRAVTFAWKDEKDSWLYSKVDVGDTVEEASSSVCSSSSSCSLGEVAVTAMTRRLASLEDGCMLRDEMSSGVEQTLSFFWAVIVMVETN